MPITRGRDVAAWCMGQLGCRRIIYRADEDAIVIAEVFHKKAATTPHRVIEVCKKRLREYDDA